ncbi:PAQR family membrane homeostasis protein TrhA [Kaistella jeonii]|uniref:Hemolysin D n=1 Tax=Kaistella jeonii TaxID=266749 RepID=A0A0C1D3U2_9FLAO|nr:hemolysin III family protein [Kaistella jeonii]KIA88465.1 hemolysin D [Kaistella jeonii]SFC17715.1 hemolysin III [Kaistella jeonii]VEI95433.1 hemolysin [Kaistella jeonii]
MKTEKQYIVHTYSALEEKLNVWSHFIGLLMSVVAMVLLIFRAIDLENIWAMISFPVFGLSMVVLYSASTLYHYSKSPKIRYRMNIVDHAAIYVLIAGSYTPFVLVSLNGAEGYTIFSIVWSIAFVGIIFKIFFTGRFNILSTVLYVAMGWLIIFSFKSLLQQLDFNGIIWLISGGVAYTLGAILYSIDKLKLNHAIFHLFVLLGTFCHFISVYFYVVPLAATHI